MLNSGQLGASKLPSTERKKHWKLRQQRWGKGTTSAIGSFYLKAVTERHAVS